MTAFFLLGPLEARNEEGLLELPAGKPRALLARLLLDANRVVPAETLIEALWGEVPPPSASKVVQVYVSQLRKALGRDRIETRAPGYSIAAEPDDLDLLRFEELAEAARGAATPARRVELLTEALSLWRGPALVEFRNEPFALAAGRRVAELRLTALERRIETELELGRHEAVIAELEALVDDEPLREPLRASLMLALYRCGRQAEALDRYRDGRRALVDSLGIEPGPVLQELERSILRQDAWLAGPAPPDEPARGPVIGAGVANLGPLLGPLCADGRELLLVELVPDVEELEARGVALEAARRELPSLAVRTASFTTDRPEQDLVRLAGEQGAELLVVGPGLDPAALQELSGAVSCDLAFAPRAGVSLAGVSVNQGAPVVVPFGGGRDEWAALELGAWLARAHGVRLRLLGVEAVDGRRDASRTLAGASLVLQRFIDTPAETVLVPPGPEGILAEEASVIVASLPVGELDATRAALVERASAPVLLVRGGLRPGGLAPGRTLTRFSWSLHDAL